MSYGLRTWDAAGVIELDAADRLVRVVSRWVVTAPTLSNDLYESYTWHTSPAIPGLVNDGTWFIVCSEAFRYEFIGGGQFRCLFFSQHGSKVTTTILRM